jgi:AcrR family transcriptional regulator
MPAKLKLVAAAGSPPVAAKRRLNGADRERQIIDGAIGFFARRGFDGQLRDLARDIGVTHALLYHYFPTKQALIERVYSQLVEQRWDPAWEAMLDDPLLSAEEKFTRFYGIYVTQVCTYEFVRILIFSGLSDHTFEDRFFAMMRERVFPRLIREMRRHCGISSRAKPSARELELLIGLHGGIFYIAMRRWVYGQSVHSAEAPQYDEVYVRDRVRAYLMSAGSVLEAGPDGAAAAPRGGARRAARATA